MSNKNHTSQEQRVMSRLEKYGKVNNLWAIQNGIWRLGARIFNLRSQGVKIKTIRGKNNITTYENTNN